MSQFGLNIFICTYYHLCIFFGEMSIQVLCSYLSWVLFLLLHYMSSLFFTLDARPLSDIWLASIFYHSVNCLFIFLIMSFEVRKFESFMKFNLFAYFWLLMLLVWYLRNHCPHNLKSRFIHILKSLMVIVFTFRPMIYFELIFVCNAKLRSNPILLHMGIKLSQYYCWKDFFPTEVSWQL